MTHRFKVAVTGARFEPLDIEERVLAAAGAQIARLPGRTEAELVEGCQGAVAVLTSAQPKFTRNVLAQLRGVRCIVRYGVGVDNLDVAAASEFGIAVCNVPDFGSEEVALHTTALMLALIRRIHEASADTRAGIWDLGRLRPMHSPPSTVVGVVGLGRIGRAVARNLSAVGFRVHGFDPFLPAGSGVPGVMAVRASLGELLAEANALSLHLPVTAQSRGLLNRETLRLMKPGAMIVNTARGELIDEAALLEALDDGRIGGAALDVLATEPPGPGHPLAAHPKVIVTPHAAWYTVQAEERLRQMAAEEVARVLRGEAPLNRVNPVA